MATENVALAPKMSAGHSSGIVLLCSGCGLWAMLLQVNSKPQF
jgi:hypothetical protein